MNKIITLLIFFLTIAVILYFIFGNVNEFLTLLLVIVTFIYAVFTYQIAESNKDSTNKLERIANSSKIAINNIEKISDSNKKITESIEKRVWHGFLIDLQGEYRKPIHL